MLHLLLPASHTGGDLDGGPTDNLNLPVTAASTLSAPPCLTSKLSPLQLPSDLSDLQNGQTNAVLTIQPNHQLAFAILPPFVYRCVILKDRFCLQSTNWLLDIRTCSPFVADWQFANLTFFRPQVCVLTASRRQYCESHGCLRSFSTNVGHYRSTM
jgi:hypothetical protein